MEGILWCLFFGGYNDILYCRFLYGCKDRDDIEKHDFRKSNFYVFYATLYTFIDDADNMWQDEIIKGVVDYI